MGRAVMGLHALGLALVWHLNMHQENVVSSSVN